MDEEAAKLAQALSKVSDALQELKAARQADSVVAKPKVEDGGALEQTPFATGEPIKVYTELFIQRIFSLDTKAQRFGTHVTVMMRWKCPATEDPPSPEEDDGDWEPMWTPKYQIKLLVEETLVEKLFSVQEVDGETWVLYEGNHLVYIFEELELSKFPTDTQDLNIILTSALPSTRAVLVPMRQNEKFVSLSHQNFFLTDFMLAEVPYVYNMCMCETAGNKVSCIEVQVKVVRRLGYYMTNVALIMCMICSCILASWSAHPADESARQSVDFNIILTAVAYKLVLTGMLPPVSYMTLLDIYVIGCFLFITAVTVSHVVVPLQHIPHITNSPLTMPVNGTYDNEETLLDDDSLTFILFTVIWILWNVFCLAYLLVVRKLDVDKFVAEAKALQADFDKSDAEVKTSSQGLGPLRSAAGQVSGI
mmetsp:Transcript_56005/g.131061  ORF Transcript_56005/g.131061 Transcript_56005/m.131061 type:complete len:421 (+) Transcript_56005:116-1378(+)